MIAASKRLDRVHRIFDAYQDRSDFVRLDRNEDPVGWDEEHLQSFLSSISPHDLAAYADSTTLVRKLSEWLQVDPACLYVTAGSDAAIKNIFETYVDPGDKILLQNPGWRMYEVYGNVYRAEPMLFSYATDLTFDIQAIIDTLSKGGVRILFLANPNQPTGTVIADKEMNQIVAAAKSAGTLVVIDEAYHLFTPQTALDFIHSQPHVIIVRTFSKAFGLAGLRIGYCVAAPERISELMLLRPVTDANSLALKCAEYVMDHRDWMMNRIADFVAGRDYLCSEMTKAGVATHASHTNFLLIRCASQEHGRSALEELRQRGYLLKGPFNFRPLENCVRVTIGPLEMMRQFWADGGEILKTHTAPNFF